MSMSQSFFPAQTAVGACRPAPVLRLGQQASLELCTCVSTIPVQGLSGYPAYLVLHTDLSAARTDCCRCANGCFCGEPGLLRLSGRGQVMAALGARNRRPLRPGRLIATEQERLREPVSSGYPEADSLSLT